MSKLKVLVPSSGSELTDCLESYPMQPFCPEILAFIQALSQSLMTDVNCKKLPELVALAFWLRSSRIKQLQLEQPKGISKALGLVIHFTPSNVDTMFIYSWVCSLLMGNKNIVRVASADSESKSMLLAQLNHLFAKSEFKLLASNNLFVSYDKQSNISADLSKLADARVIWGGDDSVNAIRALPTPPRCRDISFADRYSATLINGNALTDTSQAKELALLLWRDVQPYAQQACSSPRSVFWLGDKTLQLAVFEILNRLAVGHGAEITQVNDHLVTTQLLLSTGLVDTPLVQQHICAIPVRQMNAQFLDWHLGGGLLLIQSLNSITELTGRLDAKLQTLSYWQVDKTDLLKLIADPSIKGVDRVVPVGQALDFSVNWDGYALLSQLSRLVEFG
ncbi:acyl-CoA reductase [Aliiglaciecola sp. LCG003]|uniref:acyl-CoA reductase n=1 Tax=Aliiglaciecola sp. LCG003 TaxID=3053655 RepID=UPI0025723EBC|nr:acyl-CoA reductase [Aliiglaciecola sp. LCG003]WJG10579.1 acyl-CoA reductase [Aliiglaciecola sp. LCG003]